MKEGNSIKSIDIMLDLETTGTSAGCGILSIGACTLHLDNTFYSRIDHQSGVAIGLADSSSTMDWWGRQSAEARVEAFSGTTPIETALLEFSDWMLTIKRTGAKVYIWGNGASFDMPILGAAYAQVDRIKPWVPFNERCYRTIKNLAINKVVKIGEFEGVKHNALDDAKHQAKHLLRILQWNKELKSRCPELDCSL